MNNTAKILAAFAIGAAAGVLTGILFAPDKGTETRKKIDEQGKKMADAFKDGLNDVKDKFSSLKKDVEGKVKHAKEKAEEYA